MLNDSYNISRDEMWYADYSLKLDDTQTFDIRHLTDIDTHQIAFSPLFRYAEGVALNAFGQNIFGLRLINLFAGICAVSGAWFLFGVAKKSAKYHLLIFTILLSFLPICAKYSHHIRPDWCMMMIIALSISFLFIGIETGNRKHFYLSSILVSLSSIIYWSGLAAQAGILMVLAYLCFRKKTFVNTYSISATISLFIIGIYAYVISIIYRDQVRELFSDSSPLQTGDLVSETFLASYMSSIEVFLVNIINSGILGLFYLAIILGPLVIYFVFRNYIKYQFKQVIIITYIFLLVYIFVSLIRGSGARYLYFIIPSFTIINFYLLIKLKILIQGKRNLMLSLFHFMIFCAVILSFIHSARYAYNNREQSIYYSKYERDIGLVINDTNGRIMTSYDFAWMHENRSKFFLENFIFSKVHTYEAFINIMKENDINVVLVCETTRVRMDSVKTNPDIETWYKYLDSYLDESFVKSSIVHNKYYRRNKSGVSYSKLGYKTEIWKKLPKT